ncbi:MAG: hydrogenase expression/formation protein HypE [Pseudomonadales bacterium]
MNSPGASCPLPDFAAGETIQLSHGSGGRDTQRLLEQLIRPAFDNACLEAQQDAAVLTHQGLSLAFTTDSFVVNPLFFPGGDIGKLSVFGTVNDLAMSAARPLAISCSLIIEEGLALNVLQRIVESMASTAAACGVNIVTGDTKVVERGKGDGLFINTSGIGSIVPGVSSQPANITESSVILINGDVGRHGMAILAQREGLQFSDTIESDCQDLSGLVGALLEAGIHVQCMRDLTRGGLATNLYELCSAAGVSMHIDEKTIPLDERVQGACEILGIDPIYVACEGRMIIVLPATEQLRALEIMAAHPACTAPACIGRVEAAEPLPQLILQSCIGTQRLLEPLIGESLPRIC